MYVHKYRTKNDLRSARNFKFSFDANFPTMYTEYHIQRKVAVFHLMSWRTDNNWYPSDNIIPNIIFFFVLFFCVYYIVVAPFLFFSYVLFPWFSRFHFLLLLLLLLFFVLFWFSLRWLFLLFSLSFSRCSACLSYLLFYMFIFLFFVIVIIIIIISSSSSSSSSSSLLSGAFAWPNDSFHFFLCFTLLLYIFPLFPHLLDV